MSFHFNDQEFSDKEVADAIKAKKQERRQWCEQQAREHLAKKERRKYYLCDYYVPEADLEGYFRLPQETVDRILQGLKEIADKAPYDYEGEADDLRHDMFLNMNIDVLEYLDEPYEYGYLTDVHFDNYIYCYRFRVKRYGSEDDEASVITAGARLTDDEYIQVLTELLYAPRQLSFDGLRIALPEIGTKILNDVTSPFETSAIFMTEFNADVDAILKPIGGRDHIPGAGLFGNPFVAIAEHNAAKE